MSDSQPTDARGSSNLGKLATWGVGWGLFAPAALTLLLAWGGVLLLVPYFERALGDVGAELPAATTSLIALGHAARHPLGLTLGIMVMIGIIAGYVLVRSWWVRVTLIVICSVGAPVIVAWIALGILMAWQGIAAAAGRV